jgi:NDP-sugar pyrophosphorylase family protein
MSDLTLVILAAGMGSRYGGLKQLDGVGPSGEVIMEYSIHDAVKAGVNKVVFVIRESFEEAFREGILSRLPDHIEVKLAYQKFSDLPKNQQDRIDHAKRQKPWGTGHAVWAARKEVSSPFIAINADDYYGDQAFAQLAKHLTASSQPEPCMVGFRLCNTLSPSGTVSRGVCQVENKRLNGIIERTKLRRQDAEKVVDEDSGEVYPDSIPVSMNCWGFDSSFMDYLREDFSEYLQQIQGDEQTLQRGEFYLPAAVDRWRGKGLGKVTVLVSEQAWLGVTYPEDKDTVVQGIARRVADGVYSENLWS